MSYRKFVGELVLNWSNPHVDSNHAKALKRRARSTATSIRQLVSDLKSYKGQNLKLEIVQLSETVKRLESLGNAFEAAHKSCEKMRVAQK